MIRTAHHAFEDLTDERRRELTAKCADLVRWSLLTLRSLPDRERAYLSTNLRSAMPTPVLRAADAYKTDEFDQNPERARFRPTPEDLGRYLEVLGWLTWMEQQGENEKRDVQLLCAWGLGAQVRTLAVRYGRSDDTIRRRRDAAVLRLVREFWRDVDLLG